MNFTEPIAASNWSCPASTDGYRLRFSAISTCTVAGLTTGGVAPATQAPTVGNPCSPRDRDVPTNLLALALLVGGWTASRRRDRLAEGVLTTGLALVAITMTALLVGGHFNDSFKNKSAKDLVRAYQVRADEGEPLYFLGRPPFSASFYSAGQALPLANLSDLESGPNDRSAYVVVDAGTWATTPPAQRARLSVVSEQGQRILLRWR